MPIPVITMNMAGTTTTMTEARVLQRLLAWASPSFPIGGFAYSAGLETAIARGTVRDASASRRWIADSIGHGSAHNEAILAAEACRTSQDRQRVAELSELCLALTPALHRHAESIAMGNAFAAAVSAWPGELTRLLPSPCAYPVAFGAVAGACGIGIETALIAYLTAYTQAQISVAIRLIPIGQTQGLGILVALEHLIEVEVRSLSSLTIDDLGSAGITADIAAMNHETLETKIFRS